jgi:predicted dehydrogenase
MRTVRTAVIGIGYLGKYHAEKYATLPHAQLTALCDISSEHTKELAEKYSVITTTDYRNLLGKVDAVSIATHTPLHFEIAQFFLSHHVHVFVEKPITTTVAQADILIALAKKNNVVLQVGHIERFNPAFVIMQPELNRPRFIESERLTAFKLRGSDVSVILDLMIHDIDIALSLAKSPITDIRATGASVLSSHIDIANARIEFDNGCVASITASRIHASSARRLRVFQHDAYFNVDLQRNTCCMRRKINDPLNDGVPTIVSEEKQCDKADALKEEIASFLTAIIHQTPPAVSGQAAREALAVALTLTDIITHNNEKHV